MPFFKYKAVSTACALVSNPAAATCSEHAAARICQQACQIAQAVQSIKDTGLAAAVALSQPPKVDLEDLGKLAGRFASVGDPNARPLTVEGPEGSAHAPTSPSAKISEGSTEPPPTQKASAPAASIETAAPGSAPAPARRKLSKKEARALADALPRSTGLPGSDRADHHG
jgi:hypothetical protein